MILLAHSGNSSSWGEFFAPWELHPALVHFPLAFLLGAVVLDLYQWWRGDPNLLRPIAGLLLAGVLTGIVAGGAGLLAFFTVPAHTSEAHNLMYWHLGIMAAALVIFGWPAWVRWRAGTDPPRPSIRLAGIFGALLLLVGGALGGELVYGGGAGVDPKILAPEIRGGHSHQNGEAEPAPHPH